MKKLIFGCVIAISGMLTLPAIAQDRCCPSYHECCDTGEFGGFYVGGNAGVLSDFVVRNDDDGFFGSNAGWSENETGFAGGLQVGYDWTCNCKVFGLLTDWNWSTLSRQINISKSTDIPDNFIRTEIDWYATIRARAGVTVCCDTLLYLTGGVATTRLETTWQNSSSKNTITDTRWGWTAGLGAEFLAWCNWSLGAEILTLQFDKASYDVQGTQFPVTYEQSDVMWVARINLNYRFGDLCNWCCN